MLNDKGFCVTVTSAMALAVFVFVMRFLPDFVAWQGWLLCGPDDCNLQSWLGALSGWFGGFAALVTILFIMRQLQEQRRQTDFALGDALPTMDAIEHLEDGAELVVRIVNWNRRAMVVRHLNVDDQSTAIMPNRLTIDGARKPIDTIAFAIEPFIIPGWEDRSKGPSHAEIRLAAVIEVEKGLNIAASWRDLPRIMAGIQMLGDAHRVVLLKADTRPYELDRR